MKSFKREFASHLRSTEPDAEGLYWFNVTVQVPDDHDTLIMVKGIDLTRFIANPVCTADHANRLESKLGEWRKISVEGDRIAMGFLPLDPGDDSVSKIAGLAHRMIKAGMPPAASIEFCEPHYRQMTGQAEADLLGLSRWGAVVESCELMQVALVAIGSNPLTLKRAIEAGALSAADGERIARMGLREPATVTDTTADGGDQLSLLTNQVIELASAIVEMRDETVLALASILARIETKLDSINAAGQPAVVETAPRSAPVRVRDIAALNAAFDRVEAALPRKGN